MSDDVYTWLWILTALALFQGAGLLFIFRAFAGIGRQLRRFDEGERQLDIRQQLVDLQLLLVRSNIGHTDDVTRRVRKLLDALDADPMAKDRYFTEISALRSIMNRH